MSYLMDQAGVLSPETAAALDRQNADWDRRYHSVLAVVTVTSTQGESMEDLAYRLGMDLALGEGDGVLLLHPAAGRYYVAPGNDFASLLTDEAVERLQAALQPGLDAGDYNRAVTDFCAALNALYFAQFRLGNDNGAIAGRFPPLRDAVDFSDVAAGSWYAGAVQVCSETGLMSGIGGGSFAPEDVLSYGECTALAARLLYASAGGTGSLPPAPEGYGQAVFLDESGTVIATAEDIQAGGYRDVNEDGSESYRLPLAVPALLGGGTARLTLVLDGTERYTLAYDGANDGEPGGAYYRYAIPADDPMGMDFHDRLAACGGWNPSLSRSQWLLDACHYLKEQAGMDDLALRRGYSDRCTRAQCVALLSQALPAELLPRGNHISSLPDTQDASVLGFYQAGILDGTDAYGSFSGSQHLTRAQAAAILARIVRPELRLAAAPSPLPYTLVPLDIDPEQYTVYNFAGPRLTEADGLLHLQEKATGHMGVMDASGQWVLSPELGFDGIGYFCGDGLAAASREGRWGFIDRAGNTVIPFQYEVVSQFHDGVLLAGEMYADSYDVYDAAGTLRKVLPSTDAKTYRLQGVYDTRGGLLPCAVPGKDTMCYLDPLTGRVALEGDWYDAQPFSNGLAAVRNKPLPLKSVNIGLDGGAYGLIDADGALAVPHRYLYPPVFSDGAALGSSIQDGKSYCISPDGAQATISTGANWPWTRFSEGYAAYLDDSYTGQGSVGSGLYGYVNRAFQVRVPPLFTAATPVVNGAAFVQKDDGTLYVLHIPTQTEEGGASL